MAVVLAAVVSTFLPAKSRTDLTARSYMPHLLISQSR
jgi:hypothetical protein